MTLTADRQIVFRLPAGPALALLNAAQRGATQLMQDAMFNPGLQTAVASVLEGLDLYQDAIEKAQEGN